MGSTSPQIKAFINMVYVYQLRQTEKNLAQLQRQLQILSVVTDLSVFEPVSMEIVEFYVCLEQLLSESDPRSPLAWKVINLIVHISRSSANRIALRDEMQLVPVLSQFLMGSKVSKHKNQTLQLLQDITYGIKIYRREAWHLRLIPHLVSIILQNEGEGSDAEAAIVTLANMCRGNHQTVAICREIKERKLFMKVLTDLKSASLKVQLLVAEIFIHMDLDHSKLDSGQIMNTLDLLFMVVTDSFADHDETHLQLANDVLEEILGKADLQDCLKRFGKYATCSQNLLTYVTDESHPVCVGLLFDFIASIIHLDHSDMLNLFNSLFDKLMPWMPSRNCGTGCLKLLHALIQFADDAMLSSHTEDVIGALKASLTFKEDTVITTRETEWVNLSIQLVECLSNRDTSFQCKLAKTFVPPTLSTLLHLFLETGQESRSFMHLCNEGLSGCLSSSNGMLLSSGCRSPTSSGYLTGIKSSKSHKKKTLFEGCAEVVVRIISTVKLLSSYDPEFRIESRQVLGYPKVMQHIVYCERSTDLDLISRATNILCEESVPSENLDALIKAQKEANMKSQCSSGIEDTSNVDSAYLSGTFHSTPISAAVEDNVATLISKLNGAVDKSSLKDIPLMDVISLYEYSLASMAHSEKSLELALESSDTRLRQIQHRLLQSRTENERLRDMLRIWEGRLQHSQKEKEEVENQVVDIKNSARKFRENLVKEKTHVEKELARQQTELSSARQEITEKDEYIRTIKRQLSDAITENKSLQSNVENFCETVQKMEEESKKLKREFDDQGKENLRLEKSVVQLKKENSELEMLIRSHEETLVEKEAHIDDLTKTNETLKRIQDMIHNISAGK